MRPETIEPAANLLIEARRNHTQLTALPEDCRPETPDEAYAIQDAVTRALGPVGGWKVGFRPPPTDAIRAPLPATLIFPGPATLPAERFHIIGIEAEIAFRLGADLPQRAEAHDLDSIVAAIDSAHATIEVVDSRIRDWRAADALWKLADSQMNGALVHGDGTTAWRGTDFAQQPVTLTIDGTVAVESVGGNPAGDPLGLVVWLANHCAARGGGLKAGDIVTTGSYTGLSFYEPGITVVADFPGLDTVRVALPVRDRAARRSFPA